MTQVRDYPINFNQNYFILCRKSDELNAKELKKDPKQRDLANMLRPNVANLAAILMRLLGRRLIGKKRRGEGYDTAIEVNNPMLARMVAEQYGGKAPSEKTIRRQLIRLAELGFLLSEKMEKDMDKYPKTGYPTDYKKGIRPKKEYTRGWQQVSNIRIFINPEWLHVHGYIDNPIMRTFWAVDNKNPTSNSLSYKRIMPQNSISAEDSGQENTPQPSAEQSNFEKSPLPTADLTGNTGMLVQSVEQSKENQPESQKKPSKDALADQKNRKQEAGRARIDELVDEALEVVTRTAGWEKLGDFQYQKAINGIRAHYSEIPEAERENYHRAFCDWLANIVTYKIAYCGLYVPMPSRSLHNHPLDAASLFNWFKKYLSLPKKQEKQKSRPKKSKAEDLIDKYQGNLHELRKQEGYAVYLCTLLIKRLLDVHPTNKYLIGSSPRKHAKDIKRFIKQQKTTSQTMLKVVDFALQNEKWAKKINSIHGIKQNYAELQIEYGQIDHPHYWSRKHYKHCIELEQKTGNNFKKQYIDILKKLNYVRVTTAVGISYRMKHPEIWNQQHFDFCMQLWKESRMNAIGEYIRILHQQGFTFSYPDQHSPKEERFWRFLSERSGINLLQQYHQHVTSHQAA